MSHLPQECDHNYTSWTTEERINAAGDRCFYFAHHCTICGHVDERGAAIVEPQELRYAKTLEAGSEPDD